jgi:CheY-like chemotaxis protein
MTVLVIDPVRAARAWACLGLRNLGGLSVCEAENGPDGVDAARRCRPDAILLAVSRLGLDLNGTLAALRADPFTAAIPIFFVAAQPSRLDAARLRRLGPRSIFYAPFLPARLAAEIAAAV